MSKIKPSQVTVFKDAVAVRGHNKEVTVREQKYKGKKKFVSKHVIHFKALVTEVGPKAGVKSHISPNKKIKYTDLGLSDEALIELYVALHHYIGKVKPKTK